VRPNIERLGVLLLGLFGLVALTLGYWQVFRSADLAARPNNPRLAEEAARTIRGKLLDRTGQPLAHSEVTPNGVVRRYALPAASPVTGYFSGRYGSSAIEAAFDAQLRGERSPDLVERLRGELTHRRQVGSDVVLTVDARLQRVAAEALGDARGAVVALDPRTGAVLALATRPYFDPNAIDRDWQALSQDPTGPLFNRATQSAYVPGSTFKTVVAAAAIDLGLIDLDRAFACTAPFRVGELAPDCKNHSHDPRVNFAEAFAWSCNRTHALAALGLGLKGPLDFGDDTRTAYPTGDRAIEPSVAKLRDYAQRFGFEKKIPFDLPVEPSRLTDPGQVFFPSLLAQTGFGQGQVAATPLQMALVAATIANGGTVPRPYLVSEVRAPSGAISRVHQPGGWIERAVSPETAARVNRMMELSVEIAYAQKARIDGVKVGGKTGTAEVGGGLEPNSWFIGYAPSDNPRVAVAVILEHKGSGSDFATPAAQKVMAAALELYQPRR
jgi:peptidoglycan glycosyltransferase